MILGIFRMNYFTKAQLEAAQEEIIGAFIGFTPRHSDQYESHCIFNVNDKTEVFKKSVYESAGVDLPPRVRKTKNESGQITRATQRVKGCSKPLINDMVFKQCSLLRHVDTMNPIARAWSNAAYLSRDGYPLLQLMQDVYLTKFKKPRKGSEGKIPVLIAVAIECAIDATLGRDPLPTGMIASMLSVKPDVYCNNWKFKLVSIMEILLELDRQFLESICVELGYNEYKPSFKTNRERFKLVKAA